MASPKLNRNSLARTNVPIKSRHITGFCYCIEFIELYSKLDHIHKVRQIDQDFTGEGNSFLSTLEDSPSLLYMQRSTPF